MIKTEKINKGCPQIMWLFYPPPPPQQLSVILNLTKTTKFQQIKIQHKNIVINGRSAKITVIIPGNPSAFTIYPYPLLENIFDKIFVIVAVYHLDPT